MDNSSTSSDPGSTASESDDHGPELPMPAAVEKGLDDAAVPVDESDRETQETIKAISRLEESN